METFFFALCVGYDIWNLYWDFFFNYIYEEEIIDGNFFKHILSIDWIRGRFEGEKSKKKLNSG